MAYGLSGTNLNSARLVRVLSSLAVSDVADAKQSFAEQLGNWLDFTDAMALFSALNTNSAAASGEQPKAVRPASDALAEEYARVQTLLTDSIKADGVRNAGKVRIKLPTPVPDARLDSAADFSPYHRYYLAHQRDMLANIGPLRARARAVLAGCSPPLKRLAALDGALDEALAARERNLLATVPLLLARRYAQHHKAHQAALAGQQAADDPASWMQPGNWLAMFCAEMQLVLLAELALRLQPVAGLIEALSNEVSK